MGGSHLTLAKSGGVSTASSEDLRSASICLPSSEARCASEGGASLHHTNVLTKRERVSAPFTLQCMLICSARIELIRR